LKSFFLRKKRNRNKTRNKTKQKNNIYVTKLRYKSDDITTHYKEFRKMTIEQ